MIGFVDHDTVFAGFFDFGHHDGTLIAMSFVEFCQLGERILADDVRVQHEEGLVILPENLLSQFERTSGAEGLRLDAKGDFDIVRLFILLKRTSHVIWAVVDGEDDVCDTSCSQGLDLVKNHGPVGKFHQRLGDSESERAETGAEATNEDESYKSSQQ